jgi:putative ABC transport system permease protein
MHVLMVDHDFLKTFNIPLKQGRDFDKKIISDQTSAFVLNEAACNKIGWLNAVGKKLTCTVASGKTGLIIGVIKDFHVLSLHHAIEPLVLHVLPDNYQYILIRILPQKTSETMAFLKNMFNRINPDVPYDYFFLNEFFTRQYISDKKTGMIYCIFTGLAIVISCMGLLGISCLSNEHRTKEIGIRKVVGASSLTILFMLIKDLAKYVIFSNLIAWPLAWYVMNKWLQNYAYRIDLTIWPFLLSGLFALVIALLTVSWQAIRAATANPVEALRYE